MIAAMTCMRDAKKFIQELKILESKENDGRGVVCVKSIIALLERDRFNDARAIWEHDGDKINQYPKIEKAILDIFGCRIHLRKNCVSCVC